VDAIVEVCNRMSIKPRINPCKQYLHSNRTYMRKAVLIVTVSHRTFSGQFRHLSGHFPPLSDQLNSSSYASNGF
jgi:hypothetical protein